MISPSRLIAICCSLAAATAVTPELPPQALQDACVQGPAHTAGGPPALWATRASSEAPGLPARFRIWAQCAPGAQFDLAAFADTAAAAAVVDSLWGPMTTLMGPPVPDAGGPDEGGDSAIDFYLLAPGQSVFRNGEARAIVGLIAQASAAEPRVAPRASGFVLMGRQDIRKREFRGFVAHEFFHILQNAHNLDTTLRNDEYHWFVEASAMWAQMYFDPPGAARYVHPAFTDYFQPAQESLHSTGADHTFASYVWPLFMYQETKSGAAIANAWRVMASAQTWDDLNDAIDSQLSFAAHFRDFALRNVNDDFDGRNVIGPRYVDVDPSFPHGKRPWAFTATIEAPSGASSASFPVDLPSLTALYHSYTISGVGKVTFDFSGLQPSGDLHVDALVRIAGSGWEARPRRLSGGGRLQFCLDRPAEAVEQVYLVLSNHQKREESRIQGSVDVQAQAESCADEEQDPIPTREWRGTVRVVHTVDLDDNTLGICQDLNPLNGEVMVRYPCGARRQTYARKTFAYDVSGDTTKVIEAQYRQRYIVETCSPQNDPQREASICKVNMDYNDTSSLDDQAGSVAVVEPATGDGSYEIVAGAFVASSPPAAPGGMLAGRAVVTTAPGITLVITWSLSRGPNDPPPAEDPCDATPNVCGPLPQHEPFPSVPQRGARPKRTGM